jgi:hypothetical protein
MQSIVKLWLLANITKDTKVSGEKSKLKNGEPTGILIDNPWNWF